MMGLAWLWWLFCLWNYGFGLCLTVGYFGFAGFFDFLWGWYNIVPGYRGFVLAGEKFGLCGGLDAVSWFWVASFRFAVLGFVFMFAGIVNFGCLV